MLPRRFGIAARRRRVIDDLVRRVTESSVEPVCRLIAEQVQGMGICEARGYVRARAAAEIRRQARAAFASQPGLDRAWEPLVVMRATERVGSSALRRIASARTQQSDQPCRRAA
ncbi:MAG: hypothetical protein DCC67_08875 [Planctomycetota bacterium]|nr:MAG: hypothetical protein DCC67_08875 [Planctomycetota bacterium]